MSIAGPEDERPGDEVEGIRYFDFPNRVGPRPGGAETDPFANDPFALEGLPESHEAAPLNQPAWAKPDVGRASREPDSELAPIDPFEFALVGVPRDHAVPRPKQVRGEQDVSETEAEEPAERAAPVRFFELASLFDPPDTDAAARQRFAAAFEGARVGRGTPFLAIALRMAPHAAAVHFPIVADGIRSALHPGDVLLADERHFQLAAVLHGRRAAEAHGLFAHLADHLRMWIDDADTVLSALSALVAPDGQPFENADTFLARAFDRD